MANKDFRVRQGLDIETGNIISSATNANITLDPNGTGDVVVTLADGGNLTNTRNYVKGVIRNSTLEAAGDIWAVNSTGIVSPYQGISIDNSADTSAGPATILRSFSGGAVNGNTSRSRLIFEKARGTAASPTAVQSGDFLGSIDCTGYTSTGWLNDNIAPVTPAFFGFIASENWVSNTNLGTSFTLSQTPSATTITSQNNLVATLQIQPESTVMRGNRMSLGQASNVLFTATGCSTSGTTLTIGTVTAGTVAVGQVMQLAGPLNGQYIVANISGSGNGSTWRLSGSLPTLSGLTVTGNRGYLGSVPATSATTDILQDLRLITNTVKGSGGTTQIVTSSAGATLELRGNEIQLEDAAGTAIKGGLINYRRTYGCFHKIANVTAAAADTVYNFDWYTDTTAHVGNQGVTVTSGNPTRVNIDTQGSYEVVVEMQTKNTDNAERTAWIWLAKNGTDLTETRIKVTLRPATSADVYQLISKTWCVDNLAANDYLEVRFAVDNASGISLEYEAAQTTPFVMPAQPSATLTIVPVGA